MFEVIECLNWIRIEASIQHEPQFMDGYNSMPKCIACHLKLNLHYSSLCIVLIGNFVKFFPFSNKQMNDTVFARSHTRNNLLKTP